MTKRIIGGVFKGTANGFELDRAPTRLEGLIMLVRLLGKSGEADNQVWPDSGFDDVPEWGKPTVNYAKAVGLTNGMSSNKFGASLALSTRDYATFLLRALQLDDRSSWQTAEKDIVELTQIRQDDLPSGSFLRGDVAKLSYLTLLSNTKSGEILLNKLVKESALPKNATAIITDLQNDKRASAPTNTTVADNGPTDRVPTNKTVADNEPTNPVPTNKTVTDNQPTNLVPADSNYSDTDTNSSTPIAVISDDSVTSGTTSVVISDDNITSDITNETLDVDRYANIKNELFDLVNSERQKHGLEPYILASLDVNVYADLRANEIIDKFDHIRPNGESSLDYFKNASTAGENIATGQRTPQEVLNDWLNSRGHRANILSPRFKYMAIGYKPNYWVQLFYTPMR